MRRGKLGGGGSSGVELFRADRQMGFNENHVPNCALPQQHLRFYTLARWLCRHVYPKIPSTVEEARTSTGGR